MNELIGAVILGGVAGFVFLTLVYSTFLERYAVTGLSGLLLAGIVVLVVESPVQGQGLFLVLGSALAVYFVGAFLFRPVYEQEGEEGGTEETRSTDQEEEGEEYSEISTPQL